MVSFGWSGKYRQIGSRLDEIFLTHCYAIYFASQERMKREHEWLRGRVHVQFLEILNNYLNKVKQINQYLKINKQFRLRRFQSRAKGDSDYCRPSVLACRNLAATTLDCSD